MVCLSFLVVQAMPGGRDNAAAARTDVTMPDSAASSQARKIVVHRVDFESDTIRVAPEAAPVLDEALLLLGSSDPVVIIVDQPTATDHSAMFHLSLTRRRAKAVRRYLVDHGMAPGCVSLQPVALPIVTGERSAPSRPVELHVD